MESLEQEKRCNWEVFKKAVKARKASKEEEKEGTSFLHTYGVQVCVHIDEQGRPDALIMYTKLWEEISFSKHTIIVECDISGAVDKEELSAFLVGQMGFEEVEGLGFIL